MGGWAGVGMGVGGVGSMGGVSGVGGGSGAHSTCLLRRRFIFIQAVFEGESGDNWVRPRVIIVVNG